MEIITVENPQTLTVENIHGENISVEVVNEAEVALDKLSEGNSVARYEFGYSMHPIFDSGQYAMLTPIYDLEEVNDGDAVFCKVKNCLMTHMVIRHNKDTKWFLIGDTLGNLYGWTQDIYAIAKPIPFKEKNSLFSF